MLGETWYWAAWAVWLPLLARSVRRAPWAKLKASDQLNLWLGTIVILVLIWSLKAGVKPGLSLHLLGATLFTLCLGPDLAFVGLSLVSVGVTLNSADGWLSLALNSLSTAGVGVGASWAIFRLIERWLPKHLFVYLFFGAFFASALTVLAVGAAIALVLVMTGVYSVDYMLGEYLPYFLLLGFSEAWLTGMLMTLMVVYRPDWVVTFDDSRYLADK